MQHVETCEHLHKNEMYKSEMQSCIRGYHVYVPECLDSICRSFKVCERIMKL